MKKRNILFYLLWFVVLVVIWPAVAPGLRIFGVTPDLFLVFTVSVALLRCKEEAFVCGLVFGLAFDMLAGRMVGVSALIYMYVGLAVGIVRERLMSDGIIVHTVTMFVSTILCQILYYTAYYIAWGDLGLGKAFVEIVLPKALYTAATSFVLYYPISKCFGLIEDRGIIKRF